MRRSFNAIYKPELTQRSVTQEECRGWDVNDIVFGPAMWPTYHGLMRADFTLFDQYKFEHAGESCV
jgi:hypothetical protein